MGRAPLGTKPGSIDGAEGPWAAADGRVGGGGDQIIRALSP